ncbi:MAG: serine/threonine protein kinase, partial [Phycisphaerae bacterium]
MPADSSAWYSDPDSLLATLQKSQRPMARTPEIPGYTGLRELRRGGQGVVYIATQVSTKRTVAIKVLAAGAFASVSARRRFEREIDLAATLDHPNIVSVYDSGETIEGHPYFVMRYIDGVAFDAIVGPFATPGVEHTPTHARPIRESLELALRICDAIGYAHRRGVIHRDLKPSNIRIDRDGGPHILDFGLAKASSELFEGDIPTQMSMTGEFMGSLPWASPEQTEGISEKIDIRTDVYSFGVLLYQMLTGRFPYGVTGPFRQVLESICHASPAPPSKFRSEIDNDLETIVLKSLEKSPDRRYQSMPELAADIRHYLAGEPIAAKRDSALYTMRKNLARYRVAVAAGLAFVLLAVASAATMAVLYQRANRAAALALTSKNEAIDARDDAESQRRIAVVEAETAKQINKMLTSMLSTSLDTGREARVADALDSARDQLARSEAMSSAVRTELQNTIGISYATLGLLDEAVPLFNEAYEIQRAEFGEDDPRTLHTLTNRAWIERLQGHLDESELLYRDAVRRWTTIKDADSIEAATA